MKSLNIYLFFFIFVIGWSWPFQDNKAYSNSPATLSSFMSCPNTCQVVDSLALVAIYNSTSGPAWTSSWNLNAPVCTWNGVTLNSSGFVEILNLNSNNLVGTLPIELGNFSQLESLRLDNNNISGAIPNTIGNLTASEIIFLDNNNLSGSIPASFSNLSNLITLFLDNNQLSGTIPVGFNSLMGLQEFYIQNNLIDSIPDLSGMITLQVQNERFRIDNNQITFDDIVVHGPTTVINHYAPQDSVFAETSVTLTTGSSYTIDLGFDSGLTTNRYQWFKDGIPYGPVLTTNKLTFDPVIFSHSGEYRCQVTNTDFTQLTLHTRPVTINVICGTSTLVVDDTLCAGESRVYNGTTYNASFSSGTELLPGSDQYGCDSSILVNLNFYPENVLTLNSTLCADDTVYVDGVAYHQNNPTGVAFFAGADQNGCDSTVIIDLTFQPENVVNLNSTLCVGDTVYVDGIAYHQNNSTGTVVFPAADQFGCDSTVNINLTFHPENVINLNSTLCAGDTVYVDGVAYHQSNPTGTVVFSGADQFGCDSTVLIDLSFYPEPPAETIQQTICSGDSLLIHGLYLSASNPSATIILENQSFNGCDSTINASVDFYPVVNGTESINLCAGESTTINGITFSQSNPSGSVLFENASQNGCDSIVDINISFYPAPTYNYTATLCTGENITVNGTTYNESNPTGTEIFPGGSVNGCDSTVQINLSFNSTVEENIAPTLCQGTSIIVNGNTYNEASPSGTEILPGGSVNGCDSIIIVDLSFYPSAVESVNNVLCPGESVIINGVTYDQSNSTGLETIPNGSSNGCDSTININLSFYAQVSSSMITVLCHGDSLVVNGVVYNSDNPSGTETMPGASFTGCDSTVVVDLEFHPAVIETINGTICPEDTVVVGSTAYHIDNPNGTEVLTGASFSGCDSTVLVDLSFYEPALGELNLNLCPEQSVSINGTTYNESNPSGIEEFPNATANGCDSVLLINLTYNNNAESTLNPMLCPGESVIVNGVTYDENTPSGVEYFENEADNGCDSTVYIDLSFHNNMPFMISNTLCPGDSVVVNGSIYNFFNPSGTEVISGASYTGCDSIVEVSLSFHDAPSSTISTTLCAEEEMVINGVVYNIGHPNGTELFPSSSMNGCDSVVFIDLIFLEEASNTIAPQLCPGESLLINGTLYDENNPSGTEIISNAAASGCDSTIVVDLQFFDPFVSTLSPEICAGDTIYINGNAYHENNPSGIEVFENASFQGCDSTVQVNLDIIPLPAGNLDMTLCSGDTIFVNGTAYYQNNASGTEVFENASFQGCDSILQVNLNFFAPAEGSFETTICSGDTIFYNGQSFHEDNPSGTIILENASANGCDSLVAVEINFYELAQDTFATMLCAEETVNINGTIYDQNNPSGTEIFQTVNGCDSILSIDISFLNAVTFDTLANICEGEVFLLADRSFSESGSYAIELENAAAAGCDSIIQITLEVISAEDLGTAELGEDIMQCERSVNLIANQPLNTTGLWTSLDGMNISNPHDNTLDINDLSPGWNTFLWTLSSGQCADYDSDTIGVFVAGSPQANNDNFNLSIEQQSIDLDLFENDNLNTVDAYTFELLSTPSRGQLTEMGEGFYQYEREGIQEDQLQFTYQLCNEDCPDLCDTANVRITIEEQDIDLFDIPNAITPNEDGVNEFFMFPHLEYNPDQYPDKELIIFNRWGDIVYKAHPYQNNWHGQDNSGKFLPQGTYYYVFRLDINQGIILKGDVSILK